VVRMGVRVDNRIEVSDTGAQHLSAEVGRRVDDDVAAVMRNQNGGRRRLSRTSADLHTTHWQPIVGTPELVPEPSTVILSGIVIEVKR